MNILQWKRPKKIRSTDEHNEIHQSDTGIPGTFVPNMSDKDDQAWKARYIGGDDPRVEIRKAFTAYHAWARTLIVVRKDGLVWSTNGKMGITSADFALLNVAISEALYALANGGPPDA